MLKASKNKNLYTKNKHQLDKKNTIRKQNNMNSVSSMNYEIKQVIDTNLRRKTFTPVLKRLKPIPK